MTPHKLCMQRPNILSTRAMLGVFGTLSHQRKDILWTNVQSVAVAEGGNHTTQARMDKVHVRPLAGHPLPWNRRQWHMAA